MMSSRSMQTLIDPAFRSKMPLFEGNVASAGVSKPQNMSGFLGKQALQYSGAYFTYDPRAKDATGFTPPWGNSKTSLLSGRSPAGHLSSMEGQNHVNHAVYRQDSNSSDEGRSSSMHRTQVKQGFTPYAKSPTTVSAPVRRGKSSPPASENSVYLAIPKPVYGHNLCCNELGCMMGQRYGAEHGSPRIPNAVYEHDWMQSDAHYGERAPVQRKAQELQQRGLQFEPVAEPVKKMGVEAYSPGRARTLPAMFEPNYSGYACTSTRVLLGSLSEQSQHLQTSPRGYPILYSSHPTYEHMTSEVYQERSHMSKYGQLTQHPVFYYPQANVEVENRTQCKDIGGKQGEDVPVVLKHGIPAPRESYIVPQSLHGEIPLHLPSPEMMSNHSFIRGFDYPCYAVPRFHSNAVQIRTPLKRQHASPSWHSNHMNVSPSGQHMDLPMASVANLHKTKPNGSQPVEQLHTSPSFMLTDQTSPTRRIGQPVPLPSSEHRFFPPLTGLHVHRPILPTASLKPERVLDYSPCEAKVFCPKRPKDLPVSPAARQPPWSPNRSLDHIHTAGTNGANARKIIYSPAAATGNKHNGPTSSSVDSVLKGSLKRSLSSSSPTMKIKEENSDLCDVLLHKKRQRIEAERVKVRNKTDSPPMPVIDNVFSLAPYQAYLQASGVLFPGIVALRSVQSSEHCEVKPKPCIKEKRPDQDQQQSAGRPVSKSVCPDAPTEKPAADVVELKNIKVEKVDSTDTDNSAEGSVGQRDWCKIPIKKEPEDAGCADGGLMLVINKCEPDELEGKLSLADEKTTPNESRPAEATAQMTSPQCDESTPHDQVVSPHPKPIITPQPAETKPSFKNIPAQCLKLSTYKIILPEKHICPIHPQENSPVTPTAEFVPKIELQMPVRKHFFELHHSLCKLASKSVSASSEQDLRTWLSQLELTEPASTSTKVQKVSCLLGMKAREVWLNEEMKSALNQVLERLREYAAQGRCPFPHVMRTGAVFLPMLVVKELLFPMVQGSLVDQVLQEHKLALRPTTLSEEKILIQLHKRACSSRLRRLMSLKHLPDIYADVFNLLYYACVRKHLGLDTGNSVKDQDEGCAESSSCRSSVSTDITASPASPSESHSQRPQQDDATKSQSNRNRTKSRVKSSSRRLFLDSSLSDKEEENDPEKTERGGGLSTSGQKNGSGHLREEAEDGGSSCPVTEQDSNDNSWTCPLTSDDLSPSPSDAEPEEPSGLRPARRPSGPAEFQLTSKSCSGVILKLRRTFSKGVNRKKVRYQAVSFTDPSLSQTEDGEGKRGGEGNFLPRTPKGAHRWQRTGSFSHTLRPLGGSSKRKHRSLSKIKYCPYLSACHSAEHRRRWVLRSAVQRAQTVMRFYYPDLVGKRIRHLYEEDDKTEVWYRGEVLRIHEANSNPLKTIFEVKYDSEPEWKYYLELLIDYKKGWLKIDE